MRYIDVRGVVLTEEQVYERFERTLVWDGKTDPEEFLMEAYAVGFEDWFAQQNYEEIIPF